MVFKPRVLRYVSLLKMCPYSEFSDLYFPLFGLKPDIYKVNFRMQFQGGKLRTRKASNTYTFHAVFLP